MRLFMPEKFVALRFATLVRESGTDGSGGGFDVAVAVLLFDPVRPARLLAVLLAGVPSRKD
jgi:hypothetical protein